MGFCEDYSKEGGFVGACNQVIKNQLICAINEKNHILHRAALYFKEGKIEAASEEIVKAILENDLPDDSYLGIVKTMFKANLVALAVQEGKHRLIADDRDVLDGFPDVIKNWAGMEAGISMINSNNAKKPRKKIEFSLKDVFIKEMTGFKKEGGKLSSFIDSVKAGSIDGLQLAECTTTLPIKYLAYCDEHDCEKEVSHKTLEGWWTQATKKPTLK